MIQRTISPTSPTLLFAVADPVFVPGSRQYKGGFTANRQASDYIYLAYLVSDLYHAGVDVHIVQPYYRQLMQTADATADAADHCADLPASRVHLACDRVFYYAGAPEDNPDWLNLRIAVAFQREVLHRWIPEISPDLIQCHDWMCGLLPAAVAMLNRPVIYTLGRLHDQCMPLWYAEDMGIDTALFWDRLYYRYLPGDYYGTRCDNCADLLLSGVSAATVVNASGGEVLQALALSLAGDAGSPLRRLLRTKFKMRRLSWIDEDNFGTEDYILLYEQLLNRDLWTAASPQTRAGEAQAMRQTARAQEAPWAPRWGDERHSPVSSTVRGSPPIALAEASQVVS